MAETTRAAVPAGEMVGGGSAGLSPDASGWLACFRRPAAKVLATCAWVMLKVIMLCVFDILMWMVRNEKRERVRCLYNWLGHGVEPLFKES